LNCPKCGKELEEVIVVVDMSSIERSSYRKVEGSENVFEYAEVVDRDDYDSATQGAECPHCGARLNVKRFFDSKVELE
jgi:DNA-directed RNA polymerase subunit RPC12/RpoP